jgi:uncharacterized membrane protein
MQARDWVLKRNCSITPRQLGLAYLAICLSSVVVALVCAFHGAWYVLAYSLLELLGVGAAFVLYARHAADRERIELKQGELLVEVVEAERVSQVRLDAQRARVQAPERGALVTIRAVGTTVEVGRFVPEQQRRQFARELSLALRPDGPAAEG